MNHDELRDSIPALALHALPTQEQQLVETHVSRCAGCSFEYSQYQEVAALLAHLAPAVAPPPTLWSRIEQELGQDRPGAAADDLRSDSVIHLSPPGEHLHPVGSAVVAEAASAGSAAGNPAVDPNRAPAAPGAHSPASGRRGPAVARPGPERRSRFSAQRIVTRWAAAAVVVIGGAGVTLLQRTSGPDRTTYEAIARGPHTVLPLRATTLAQGARGEVFVAPDGKVAVTIHSLPAPGSGTYTMWLAADGQTRSLGDFRPDAAGEVRMATAGTVGHTPRLIVTLESRPGNTSPDGPPILSA